MSRPRCRSGQNVPRCPSGLNVPRQSVIRCIVWSSFGRAGRAAVLLLEPAVKLRVALVQVLAPVWWWWGLVAAVREVGAIPVDGLVVQGAWGPRWSVPS